MKAELTPDQKRRYLELLLSKGQQAAYAYLEQTDCEDGIFIFKSEDELRAFERWLEECCPDRDGTWVFLPDNGRG